MTAGDRLGAAVRALRGRPSTTAPATASVLDTVDPEQRALLERCRPYTLASDERVLATMDAVDYAVRRGVPGAFAECGVWRGGSVLAMVLTLQRLGVDDRDIWLYDTFEGMTEPGEHDVSTFDGSASAAWADAQAAGQQAWGYLFDSGIFGLQRVQELLLSTGYPADRIHFAVGRVEDTLPENGPDSLAVLRLDTDWYESTLHELDHLEPRLSPGGVLIVDDYGHWQGARRALDEYLAREQLVLLLARTDYTGRMAVKPG